MWYNFTWRKLTPSYLFHLLYHYYPISADKKRQFSHVILSMSTANFNVFLQETRDGLIIRIQKTPYTKDLFT